MVNRFIMSPEKGKQPARTRQVGTVVYIAQNSTCLTIPNARPTVKVGFFNGPMKRTLTDEDIKAIAEAVQINHDCTFTEDDRHDIRTLLKIYRESTGAIRRGFIALVLLGALALLIVGASFKLKIGG